MNKKIVMFLGTLMTASMAVTANSQWTPSGLSGFYIGIDAGYIAPRGDIEPRHVQGLPQGESVHGYSVTKEVRYLLAFGGVVGYALPNQPIRLEASFSYDPMDLSSSLREELSGARQYSFMLRGYYDIYTKLPVIPYVGLGLGYDSFLFEQNKKAKDADPDVANYNQSGLSYEATIGAIYFVSEHFTLGVNYTLHGVASESKSVHLDPGENPGVKAKISLRGVGFKHLYIASQLLL